MKIRSVYGISEMATTHDIVNDVLLEDKLWLYYSCLYDVRAACFKNRDVRQLAMEEIDGKNMVLNESTSSWWNCRNISGSINECLVFVVTLNVLNIMSICCQLP